MAAFFVFLSFVCCGGKRLFTNELLELCNIDTSDGNSLSLFKSTKLSMEYVTVPAKCLTVKNSF